MAHRGVTTTDLEVEMSQQNPYPVVVAVGYDPMDAALTYAADEASRAGCGLHLVHVVHQLAQDPEDAAIDPSPSQDEGYRVLRAARELARDLLPDGVPVTTELRRGGVVPDIVTAGDHGRMIVLQRRPLSKAARVLTRSTSSGVAAHAEVCVVSVPAGWEPPTASGGAPTTTVGVDVPWRSEDMLRVALETAQERGARLRILHAWRFPRVYDDLTLSRTKHEEWTARATDEIQQVLAGLAPETAGVEIAVEVRHGGAADALIEAGRTSDLLVVGRHDPVVPIGSHLGPVARAVLHGATCPVLLAYTRPRARWGSRHQQVQAG